MPPRKRNSKSPRAETKRDIDGDAATEDEGLGNESSSDEDKIGRSKARVPTISYPDKDKLNP
jgi:hypothetical protein